jgi:hypothetical protein
MWRFIFLTGNREYLIFKYFCFGVLLKLLRKENNPVKLPEKKHKIQKA